MSDKYIHGCWATGTDRVCEDGTKGCSRTHPLRVLLETDDDLRERLRVVFLAGADMTLLNNPLEPSDGWSFR